MALSVRKVERLTAAGHYLDAHGLYLQVKRTGAKSWLLRWERGGRDRWMGLGPLHTFSLDEARERARLARQLLRDGVDPRDARHAERARRVVDAAKAVTFDQATQQYYDAHSSRWQNAKHRAQFLATLAQYASPHFGSVPVAAIDMPMVLKALEPIWKTKTETASRVRGRIESVLDFATVRGYRSGDNPARWSGWLSHALPSPASIKNIAHHAAMPFNDVPAFMAALAKRDGVAARALEFAVLTAARTGEVVEARWDELDLTSKIWTIPASRMKSRREHRVPLSKRATEVLARLPREAEFVFPGARARTPISNMAMTTVMRRMEQDAFTVHGFRSAFRDWIAERTSYPNIVGEAALAHVVGDKTEAAYRRGDLLVKRTHLMNDWAKFLSTEREVAAVVTSISARGSRRERKLG